jgi:signal transduction histidine kinase/ActR/RegA family two-component response regulator
MPIMAAPRSIAADHLSGSKKTILTSWRNVVRADPKLPERRLSFTDAELLDHLPALLDTIIKELRGEETDKTEVHKEGAQHGKVRRSQGYSITQLVREFSIFRKLLGQSIDQLAVDILPQQLSKVREQIISLADESELGSVAQYVEETRQERDTALEEVRESNQQKDHFLAVLSHELRNPLASIRAAVDFLRRDQISASQQQRAVEIIARQAGHQARLIDDLLDINRISQGRIQLKCEAIDLRQPLKNAIENYLPMIQSKSVSFRFEAPSQEISVYADPVRIEQIVTNLLANSLKFTKAGESIEVVLRKEGEKARISVHDTGAGIEPSSLENIFELFAQAQPSKGEDGLGVGLWLAKQLVQMHQGTIKAKSEGLQKGTELTVELPCMRRATRSNVKRVLLVEDDPDQRELLPMLLQELDAEFTCVKDGSEALAVCGSTAFDVCILDLNLPDITGYELIRRIFRLQAGHRPATIALTGYGRPEDEKRVKEAGFDYHFVKPADLQVLKDIIISATSTT